MFFGLQWLINELGGRTRAVLKFFASTSFIRYASSLPTMVQHLMYIQNNASNTSTADNKAAFIRMLLCPVTLM